MGFNSGFWLAPWQPGTFYMNLKYGTSRHADAGTTHNRSGWNAGNQHEMQCLHLHGDFPKSPALSIAFAPVNPLRQAEIPVLQFLPDPAGIVLVI